MLIRSVLFVHLTVLVVASLLTPAIASAQGEGIIDIRANVDDAIVLIDGEVKGSAPLLEIVAAGRHVVRVERSSFAPFEQTVDLAPDTTVEILARLLRVKAGLSVQVDVAGARVFVDGRRVGDGDVVVDPIDPGRHLLVVETDEFGRYEGRIDLPAARMTPVVVKMRGSLGKLEIQSNPAGAQVTLDGEEIGLTPLAVDPLRPGSHSLRLSKDGYSDVLQTVAVESGKATAIDVVLVEDGGFLEIRPVPREAKVLVNGVEVGAGKQAIGPLKPGMYSVRVTAPDHSDFVQPVQVETSRTASLTARLDSFDGRRSLPGLPPPEGPVYKHPAFWAGVGGGVAVIVIASVAASSAASSAADPEPQLSPGTEPPSTTYTFSLP